MPKKLFPYLFNQKLMTAFGILMGIILLNSCGSTRHLKENEYLLRKNIVKLNSTQTYADKGALKGGLQSVIIQQNNTYFLGRFPIKTWLYNLNYKKYERDTNNFQVRTHIVEKPVVFNKSSIAASTKQMKQLLLNQGYFNAEIKTNTDTSGKRIHVTYWIETKEEYLIDTIKYTVDSSLLEQKMRRLWEEKSLIKQSLPYSNGLLSAERSQMVNLAKENGFYKFNTDNIQFELDTMAQRKLRSKKSIVENAANVFAGKLDNSRPTVSINTIVKEQEHYNAFDFYKYRFIYVYPEYESNEQFNDAYKYQDTIKNVIFRYKNKTPKVNNKVISSKLQLRSGNIFKQSDYNKTLLDLNDLIIFNYARIFIFEDTTRRKNESFLDAHIVLNPGKTYDLTTNFELSGGDLYVAGSAFSTTLTNKNLFRGANQLSLAANYGFELNQTTNTNQTFFERFYLMTQNFGLNTKLTFPKFIAPFGITTKGVNNTNTIFNFGVNFLDRASYFRIRTFNSSFGYSWKTNQWTTWNFNPIFFNSLNLSRVSDSFQIRLDQVQAIRNAYQENFILGENFEFIHNTEGKLAQRHHFVRLGLEESGVLMRGLNGIVKAFNDKGWGFNYANYIRFDFDLRQYFTRSNRSFVMRMHGGIGIPYGDSKTLPYIKQYFVGGAYSIRGWGPRLLGPGSYYNPALNNKEDRLFIDQSGDIKLEWNFEYRFRMIQLFAGAIGLNGAFFADAGNIWLAKQDVNLPGASFQFSKLYKDIALSTGAGLRADLGGFLVLRADWAFALKKPYVESNNGWVIDEIDFGSKDWRTNNINLNVGIGLPF